MPRLITHIKRLLKPESLRGTDQLGLCDIIYKVPKPVDPKRMRVIEVVG